MPMERTRVQTEQKKFFKTFLMGGASASLSRTITAPVERVKLLIQNQDATAAIRDKHRPYAGAMDCLKRVSREQGVLSFWRGNLVNVGRYMPAQGLNFAMKEVYKKALYVDKTEQGTKENLIGNFVSGGVAGATTLGLLYPLDFVRTRLALDIGRGRTREFKNIRDVARKIAKTDGINGFYRGLGTSLLLSFTFRGFYFGMFDTFRPYLNHPDG